MSETPRHDATQASSQHEANVVGFWPIIVFGGALLVLTVIVLVLMGGLLRSLMTRSSAADAPLPPLAASRQPPPQPHLQVAPSQELQAVQQQEDALLSSYGWVDRANGIVRVPINRAMELVAERGLPTRPQPPETR